MIESAYQECLPEGLELRQRLHGAAAFGKVYEAHDTRLGTDEPVKRVVRFISAENAAANWRKPYLERLQQLTRASIPYVSTPVGAGCCPDGTAYIVSDHYHVRLWDKLPGHQGLDFEVATTVLHQVLVGLAGLHRNKMAHGDVRSKNIFLNNPDSPCPAVSLADAAIGPMTWWSGGALRDSDAQYYYPPEWRGRTQEPSFRADLYAVGLVATELFLGRDGNLTRQEGANVPSATVGMVREKMKNLKVGRSTHRLVSNLLAEDPDRRPLDANEALQRWEKFKRAESRLMPLALMALISLILAAVALIWIGAERLHRTTLVGDLRNARGTIAELEADNERLSGEVARLEKKVEELERTEGAPPNPVVEPTSLGPVQRYWQDHLGELPGDNVFEKLHYLAQIVNSDEMVELNDEESANVKDYYNSVRSFKNNKKHFNAWCRVDRTFQELVDKFVSSPWNKFAEGEADSRYRDLQIAADEWNSWAGSKNMKHTDVPSLISSVERPGARMILQDWYDELVAQCTQGWTLRLKEGTASKDYGTDRIVTLYVDGSQAGPHNEHEWLKAKLHTYTAQMASRDMNFDWRTNQSFGILLEQDGYLSNTNMIDTHYHDPFDGLLAVWKAHREGKTEKDGNSLQFEIVDCPGPPREVFQKESVPDNLKPLVAGSPVSKPDPAGESTANHETE